MQQQTLTSKIKLRRVNKPKPDTAISLPVTGYRTLQIPGVDGACQGTCFVRVTDLPATLEQFMAINPRVPNRTKTDLLSGPVAAGILNTLQQHPTDMVLKNQGIYLLCESAEYDNNTQALTLKLTDQGLHGIVNGGHTYAAIRQAIEQADELERNALRQAYVRLQVYTGIDADFVPEMAEGLNKSKQVDDPSLLNLQGDFDAIRKVMKGRPGAMEIAYHQGDNGSVYISEVLAYLEMFNLHRFNSRKHPNSLYNRQGLGLKYFSEDLQTDNIMLQSLIGMLPDFLGLADTIRLLTPKASSRNSLQFGRLKVSSAERAGSKRPKAIPLPFIANTTDYRVPNGWVFPMLAAFRANLHLDATGSLEWRMPVADLLQLVIDDLVAVCVAEHRDNNMRPEQIGKREAAYSAAYTKVELVLAKRGLIK